MPQERSIDIDTKLDFLFADSIINVKIDKKFK
jgi:CMP-N-acetylneuraminic acid synthetase